MAADSAAEILACASGLCLAYLAGLKRQNVPIARAFGLLAANQSPRQKKT
jgi:hypothetical protein